MKVKEVAIGEVKPYPGNPRNNDAAVDAVAESIKEFGFRQPIVVDADGVVIVGHTRLRAAKRLGLETVPVVVAADLTPEQAAAYRLADNKTGELAEWDLKQLNIELDGLLDFGMERFGFDASDTITEAEILDDKYSKRVGTVDYQPSDRRHEVSDLYSFPRSHFEEIEALDTSDEMREFLHLRDAWLAEFNFAKIADYYCNQATPAEQRMFEELALVLLDRDQMIEHGFADLLGEVLGNDEESD